MQIVFWKSECDLACGANALAIGDVQAYVARRRIMSSRKNAGALNRMDRRTFLWLTAAGGGAALLAACGGSAPPQEAATAAPAVAAPTAAPAAAAPTAAPAAAAAPTAAPAAAAPTAAPAAAAAGDKTVLTFWTPGGSA